LEKVSLVVPTFNAVATLDRCLRSVAAQDGITCELIVADGGSTDGTLEILAKRRGEIARLLPGPDGGIYDAMNKGAALATGAWLHFLGADDTLHGPRALAALLENGAMDADLLYGDVWWNDRRYAGAFDARRLACRNVCHQAILLRRTTFQRFGGFSPGYPLLADYELNLRLFGDPAVRKRWVDTIVADYGAGGRSARGDWAFELRKPRLVRQHLGVSYLEYALLQAGHQWRKLWGAAA
jgi:glycosyltransferase involved in cell wall biosynthesis